MPCTSSPYDVDAGSLRRQIQQGYAIDIQNDAAELNLRFKAPGSFWNEKNVEQLMHLRAYFKAGRWDELIKRVIRREFGIPSFVPDKQKLRNSLHVIENPKKNRNDCQERAA